MCINLFFTYLEDCLDSLEHENIQDPEDKEERKLCRKESQEPLGSKHMSLETNLLEMVPQVGHILFQQSV